MYTELEKKLLHADRLFRIGTGELSDSLTFDHLNEQSRDLVKFFSTRKNAILELKTKNTTIDHFINVRHNRHTVVSWSLNSEKIARTDEKKSPSVEERIRVADQVQRAGFLLGFHFDPLITHIEWEDEYRLILDRLFSKIKPENIAWISLGALRYPPQLDEIIRQNHPESDIVLGELLPGEDKKYRYFRPIRTGMFQKMYNWIKSKAPDVFVYLCMESDQVWRESFGWSPGSSGKLKKLLDKRVFPQSSC
jgi:spore photoproduct lyase